MINYFASRWAQVEQYLVGSSERPNYENVVLVRTALVFFVSMTSSCTVIIWMKGFILDLLLPTLVVMFLLALAMLLVRSTGSPVVPALLMTCGVLCGATMRAQASGGIFCHNLAFFVLPPSTLLFFAGPRLACLMFAACTACLVQLWRQRDVDRAVVLTLDADYVGTVTLAVLFTVMAGVFALSYLWWVGSRRALERAEQALKETQDANNAKSQFMAFLCHEIRNPLHSIMNMTDFLLQSESGVRGSHRADAVSIRSSCDLMLAIVDDVLDLSRIESGRIAFEHLPFDLRRLMADHVRAAQPTAHAKGITLAFACTLDQQGPRDPAPGAAPAPRVAVVGDPTRVNQVLANLLSNALKFTTSGGSITVTLDLDLDQDQATDNDKDKDKDKEHSRGHSPQAQQSPREQKREQRPAELELACHPVRVFRVSVSDTGIGIAAEDLPKLFKPYSQAGLSTARTHGGSGLGLSIVSQLVRMMGGQLQVRSEPARGTTFTLTLPLHSARPADLSNLVESPAQPVRGIRATPTSAPAPAATAGHRRGRSHGALAFALSPEPIPMVQERPRPDPAPSPRPTSPAATVPSPGADASPLLLVEDDAINQKLLVRMVGLPGSGIRTLCSHPDPEQARQEADTLLTPRERRRQKHEEEPPRSAPESKTTATLGPGVAGDGTRLMVHVASDGLHAVRLVLRRSLYLYLRSRRSQPSSSTSSPSPSLSLSLSSSGAADCNSALEASMAARQLDRELCSLLASLVPSENLPLSPSTLAQRSNSSPGPPLSRAALEHNAPLPLPVPGPLLAAVAAFCPRPYPLVLMDLNMPVLDGYCASRVLRHLGFTMPIVAVSANALLEERQKATQAGITDFLAKPFRKQNFIQIIQQAFAN